MGDYDKWRYILGRWLDTVQLILSSIFYSLFFLHNHFHIISVFIDFIISIKKNAEAVELFFREKKNFDWIFAIFKNEIIERKKN